MATKKIKIGNIPVGRGEWSSTTDYFKENTVSLYGMSFRALKDNTGVAPATLNSDGYAVLNDDGTWQLVSGTLDATNQSKSVQKLLAAEGNRQQVFESNEQSRQATFEANEAERQVLYEKVETNKEGIEFLNANTGVSEYSEFSEVTAYAVGDVVLYEGLLKRFTSAHEAGAWDASQVEDWSERNEREEGIRDIKETLKSENLINRELFDRKGAITSNGIETTNWESYRYTTKPIHLSKGQTISVSQYLNSNAYFLSINNAGTYEPLVEGTGVNPYFYQYTADADIDVYVCVFTDVVDKVSIKTPYARLSQIEERIDKNSEYAVRTMIISEAFELTSATRTNELVTSANVVWANGEIGSITLVRDNEGLVTKYSGTIGSKSFTMTINRDSNGDLIGNKLTIN